MLKLRCGARGVLVQSARGRVAQLVRAYGLHPPVKTGLVAQLVRALRSHRRGQRFDSSRVHQSLAGP